MEEVERSRKKGKSLDHDLFYYWIISPRSLQDLKDEDVYKNFTKNN